VTTTGAHSIEVDRFSDSSGDHLLFKVTTNARGIGMLTLKNYQMTDTVNFVVDVNQNNDQTSISLEWDTHVHGPSPSDDFFLHTNLHVSTNANGDLNDNPPLANFSTRCQ
jgi:hypothetical protein